MRKPRRRGASGSVINFTEDVSADCYDFAVVNDGCVLCADLMRDSLAAIGRYLETRQSLGAADAGSRELLAKLAEQHRAERDRAVGRYQSHILEHRANHLIMTA